MKMYHFWNGDYSATFTVMAKNKEDAINNVKEFIEGSENKDWLSIDFQDALRKQIYNQELSEGEVLQGEVS